jgi:hypothetical protein
MESNANFIPTDLKIYFFGSVGQFELIMKQFKMSSYGGTTKFSSNIPPNARNSVIEKPNEQL